MSIWHTNPPTPQDYPIWAYTDDVEDVVLIRDSNSTPPGDIVWCHATIPLSPDDTDMVWFQKYQSLFEDSEVTRNWSLSDWFKAGYRYGKQSNSSCGCKGGQALLFEEREEEPKESAYDERL